MKSIHWVNKHIDDHDFPVWTALRWLIAQLEAAQGVLKESRERIKTLMFRGDIAPDDMETTRIWLQTVEAVLRKMTKVGPRGEITALRAENESVTAAMLNLRKERDGYFEENTALRAELAQVRAALEILHAAKARKIGEK